MLYDVFICHASEDKESVARPLAEHLRARHVEVWYDEFTLTVGDSLRRSIDRGLTQSRFGIVVLSPSFFAKNWPQYELDGLLDRELSAGNKVILPVWHNVDHDTVALHSPALAARIATVMTDGLPRVVNDLLRVIRPDGSPLVIARDLALDRGLTPPVVTDPYWIEVIEASNRVPGWGGAVPEESAWDRWSFPLPPRDGKDAISWGERLAWTAMQLEWVRAADEDKISVTTPPEIVVAFIESRPGLLDVCIAMPDIAAEYAPQLTIPGNEGPLAEVFEREYRRSLATGLANRSAGSRSGSGLTTDGQAPRCDECWALRDPHLGLYQNVLLAQDYFHADLFGPNVALFDDGDHLFWLLSSASDWLPRNIHAALLDGLAESHGRWQWGPYMQNRIDGYAEWPSYGALAEALVPRGKKLHVRWEKDIEADVLGRSRVAKDRLGLEEDDTELVQRFRNARCIERSISKQRRMRLATAGTRSKERTREASSE